jgi:hypothetical protein
MKTTTIVLLVLIVNSLLAQTKKAAIGFLYTYKPEVTFYGNANAMNYANQHFYFGHGATFNDNILFTDFKLNIKSMMSKLGFRLVEEDSIINTDEYKNLVKKNAPDKGPSCVVANGYAYAANFGLLFSKTSPNPDVMIEAYGDFDLNVIDVNNAYLVYTMTVVGYNEKKKKVFSFKAKELKGDKRIKVKLKPSYTSGWGYEIAEDISQKQSDCVTFALAQIEEQIPEQIEKVKEFYNKK